jgi:hypothetical protein
MSRRPSLALVVDRLPPWLVANFNATQEHLDFTAIEVEAGPVSDPVAFRRVALAPATRDPNAKLAIILQELKACDPDAVLTFGWSGGRNLASLSFALGAGKPAIVASDSKANDFARNPVKEAMKRHVIGLFAAGWAAGRHAQAYLQQLGMAPENIIVGPVDTIDVAHFEQGAALARRAPEAARARLNLPERFFLATSRLSPEKNLPALVKAYAQYRERAGLSAWNLVIVGEGPTRGEIEAAIAQTGQGAFVTMTGWVGFHDLPAYYGLASGFIHPTVKDTWACVVNEAAAAGLPLLVSSAAGCAPELVENGRNGLVFDPHSVTQMAEAMEKLTHGGADLSAFGARSLDIIAGWRPDTYSRSLADVTHLALRGKARHAPLQAALVQRLALREWAIAQSN